MPKIIFECENCGQKTEKYSSHASRFCSKECYWEFKSEEKFDKLCPRCSKRFSGPQNQIYCSKECKRKNDKSNEKGQYLLTCPVCKTERIVLRPVFGARKKSPICKSCAILEARRKYPSAQGKRSHSWKGGRRIDSYGYVKLHKPNHPFADGTNYVREHIYVICEAYGVEYLVENGGVVHHIDGNKANNHIDNLYVCTQQQNKMYTTDLLNIAYSLVREGMIEFIDGEYRCPLLSDKTGVTRQIR